MYFKVKLININKKEVNIKVQTIEKMVVVIIIGLVLFVGTMSYFTIKALDKAGGVKGVVVTIGKEVKEIKEKINE